MKASTEHKSAIGACDVCGSTEEEELYTALDRLSNSAESFSIVRCVGCGVLRTLPEMIAAELGRFYPNDYWGGAAEPSLDWIVSSQAEKTRFLARCGLNGGAIL